GHGGGPFRRDKQQVRKVRSPQLKDGELATNTNVRGQVHAEELLIAYGDIVHRGTHVWPNKMTSYLQVVQKIPCVCSVHRPEPPPVRPTCWKVCWGIAGTHADIY